MSGFNNSRYWLDASGFCFREYGILPTANGFATTFFQLGSESADLRKGHIKYVQRVVSSIGSARLRDFDRILAVGDSVGDCRFFMNLTSYLGALAHPARVEGHFLLNPEIARLGRDNDGLHLHDSWQVLAQAVANAFTTATRTLAFIDIDRTIIFPRGEEDQSYFDLRNRGLRAFISRFASLDLTESELLRVDRINEHITHTFSDYCANEFAVDCFRNEETVAALGLMLSTGLIKHNEVEDLATLRSLTAKAVRRVNKGGWISGLWKEGDDFSRCAGEKVWNRRLCSEQLVQLDQALQRNSAVFLPEYRVVEAGIISDAVGRSAIPLNSALLRAVGSADKAILIFLTDRPATTLGEDPAAASSGAVRSSFFERLWNAGVSA